MCAVRPIQLSIFLKLFSDLIMYLLVYNVEVYVQPVNEFNGEIA